MPYAAPCVPCYPSLGVSILDGDPASRAAPIPRAVAGHAGLGVAAPPGLRGSAPPAIGSASSLGRLPVRSLVGAVASAPMGCLLVVLALALGPLETPHWVLAAVAAAGLAVSWATTVVVSRRVTARFGEVERQRDAFYQEFGRLSKAASLGEVASSIAHDLNNPLAIMSEEAGWLQDLLHGDDVGAEHTRREFESSVEQKSACRSGAPGSSRAASSAGRGTWTRGPTRWT